MSRGETERSGGGGVHSLWLSRKKGERVNSSASGEERQGGRMCSAPVRKRSKGEAGRRDKRIERKKEGEKENKRKKGGKEGRRDFRKNKSCRRGRGK